MNPSSGRLSIAVLLSISATLLAHSASAGDVTYAADSLRTGWYSNEPTLSAAQVASPSFGQIFAPVQVRGVVTAQPLVSHGVLLIVTEENWAYGIDAATGMVLWSRGPSLFGPPWNPLAECAAPPANDDCNNKPSSCPGDTMFSDITRCLLIRDGTFGPRAHVGITSTPVVDDTAGIVYIVSRRYVSSTGQVADPVAFYLHALSVSTGAEQTGFPIQLQGFSTNGHIAFEPRYHMQRPALLLENGFIFVGFGSFTDWSTYRGWVMAVSLSQHTVTAWVSTQQPRGSGAIWQAGTGLMADTAGRILFSTANGSSLMQGSLPTPGNMPPSDLSDSVVALSLQSSALVPLSFFTPFNAGDLNLNDCDLGSAGPIGLPEPYFGNGLQLVLQAGKEGKIYLHDSAALGGFAMGQAPSKDKVLASSWGAGTFYSHPAVWPGDGGYIYFLSTGDGDPSCYDNPMQSHPVAALTSYHLSRNTAGLWSLTQANQTTAPDPPPNFGSASPQTTEAFPWAVGSPIVTSNGIRSASALVWVLWSRWQTGCMVDGEALSCDQSGELRAYDGLTLALIKLLPIGEPARFALPGVGDGRIYVATQSGLVFGFGMNNGVPQALVEAVHAAIR